MYVFIRWDFSQIHLPLMDGPLNIFGFSFELNENSWSCIYLYVRTIQTSASFIEYEWKTKKF